MSTLKTLTKTNNIWSKLKGKVLDVWAPYMNIMQTSIASWKWAAVLTCLHDFAPKGRVGNFTNCYPLPFSWCPTVLRSKSQLFCIFNTCSGPIPIFRLPAIQILVITHQWFVLVGVLESIFRNTMGPHVICKGFSTFDWKPQLHWIPWDSLTAGSNGGLI